MSVQRNITFENAINKALQRLQYAKMEYTCDPKTSKEALSAAYDDIFYAYRCLSADNTERKQGGVVSMVDKRS